MNIDQFGKLMKTGYLVNDSFFENKVEAQLLAPIFKQMCMLEMEGKFQVRKVHTAGVPLTRNDKFMNVDLTNLEGVDEFRTLRQLVRLLFFIPFEINKKVSLNLQVSETFELSFMDHDHTYINRRAESTFGKHDTGVKLTIVFAISSKNESPTLKLYKQSQVPEKEPIEEIKLNQNTLVLFNSRAFEYEITDPKSKSVFVMSQVPGPACPPEIAGAPF